MPTALILAGHGSHISPQTAGVIWNHVDALRAMGVADEVTAAFWKEAPSFSRVMDTVMADQVTVVPVFTAQGYFTRTVIPSEMALDGVLTACGDRSIRYTRTVGEHPYLSEVIQQRIVQALAVLEVAPDQVAIAIIGHSTRRSAESRLATERQANLIRDSQRFPEVTAVFLDDLPDIPQIYTLTTRPIIIAVPYFLAAGSHTTIDVPSELGIAQSEYATVVQNRTVYYTKPVGVDDTLLNAILELVQESGTELYPKRVGSEWDKFPEFGRDILWPTVVDAGNIEFGQLHLTNSCVRPLGSTAIPIDWTPSELRTHIRETTTHFRSLSGADDLPQDWAVLVDSPAKLHAIVETIYPGAVAHWAAAKNKTLQVTSLELTLQRQTGMFRNLQALSFQTQQTVTGQVCGHCVYDPVWFLGQSGQLPCPEACNTWLSEALTHIEQKEV